MTYHFHFTLATNSPHEVGTPVTGRHWWPLRRGHTGSRASSLSPGAPEPLRGGPALGAAEEGVARSS